jgi:hypothetical protein
MILRPPLPLRMPIERCSPKLLLLFKTFLERESSDASDAEIFS